MPKSTIRGIALLSALGLACETSPVVNSTAAELMADQALWQRMITAEDSRGTAEEGVAPLIEGLASANSAIRRIAVRGLGRLEADSLVRFIAPLLEDSVAVVRAEAANALGQAVFRGSGAPARPHLETRIELESDPKVRGVIAETLGRLRHSTAAEVDNTIALIFGTPVPVSRGTEEDFMLGAAKGLFFLVRQPAARDSIPEIAFIGLRKLITFGIDQGASADTLTARRVRTVGAAALIATSRATAEDIATLLRDPDPLVRREALAGVAVLPPDVRATTLESASNDDSPIVRFEAVRTQGSAMQPSEPCAQFLDSARDANTHVQILALRLLSRGCGGPGAVLLLDSVAGSLSLSLADTATGWQTAANAMVSLAALDSARARRHMNTFAASANPFVRVYAARAAARLGDSATLMQLAADVHANVRTQAVQGLVERNGRAADSLVIAQLGENDSQLLQTAADALEGSRHAGAVSALVGALDRISTARRETWRDSRIALLRRINELGSRTQADRLRPYLSDYDPRVATAAADILERWTGQRPESSPALLPRLQLPSFAAIDSLEHVRVTLETAAGDIELRLLPFEAPTNAYRFARLAREGYWNGLTFHRVEPNFVLQGGSPGANEYAGDGPYTRDELGLPGNWRGTMGLSTRGRDTGDAQIFLNLIDNTRLDHNYTVFAEITSGIDVMDRVLEGTVIRNVVIR